MTSGTPCLAKERTCSAVRAWSCALKARSRAAREAGCSSKDILRVAGGFSLDGRSRYHSGMPSSSSPAAPDSTTPGLICPFTNEPLEPVRPGQPYAEMSTHPAFHSPFSGAVEVNPNQFLHGTLARDAHIAQFSFMALPKETLDALAELIADRRTLDAGAGTGYLSEQLAHRGAWVVASDLGPISENDFGQRKVWRRDHEGDSCELLPGDFGAVILAWPPMDEFAFRVASLLRPGQVLIYQGEGAGGCTADETFFAEVRQDSRWQPLPGWTGSLNQHHLQFYGIHDRWLVWERVGD